MLFKKRNAFSALVAAKTKPRVRRSPADSGWSRVAVAVLLAVFAGALIVVLAIVNGGRQTVASRSAAAFREAQRKGIPVAEAAHGHGALSPGTPAEHGAEYRRSAEKGEAGHGGHAETGMVAHDDHAMTQPETEGGSPHAGMQHGTGAAAGSGKPPRSTTEGAAGHAAHEGMPQAPAGMPEAALLAPLASKSAVARPGQPAATLELDRLDAPAETSRLDAQRSAELAAGTGSGGHGMQHGATTYRQLDAGRETGPTEQQTSPPRDHGMSHGSTSAPAPTPETKKPRPAATPAPTPGGHVHPSGSGVRDGGRR